MRIVRSSQTYEDIVEIGVWLGAEDSDVALRFFDSYEATLEVIKTTPKIGSLRSTGNGEPFRIWFVKGFEKVLIIYQDHADEIKILRVIHSAQDYLRVM